MAALYELAILGDCQAGLLAEIRQELVQRLAELGLTIDEDVAFFVGHPVEFCATGDRASAALCFPVTADQEEPIFKLMEKGISVVPIATTAKRFTEEFPNRIGALNGLCLDKAGIKGLVVALLECASLLPRQRRVFISYRRDESMEAALQLYAALASRLYDVFLDTHEIHPGQHFQEVLWQRLCDADVLLFLDTQNYFESRWTEAEFGRAMWRGISMLRVAWPSVAQNERAQLATSVVVSDVDFDAAPGHLRVEALTRICRAVEEARTKSVASRFQLLISTLTGSVARGGGRVEGISLRRSLIVATPNGKRIAVYPSLGVPTAYTLYDATRDDHPPPVAVLYDDTGIDEREWKAHMSWIAEYVKGAVRLVSSYRAGWDFSDWN
jgi:hypothetical protein